MTYASKEELREEVIEWTLLMREDGDFSGVRDVAIAKGLSPNDIFLSGFIRAEDESMFGCFIVDYGHCFLFEVDPVGSLIRWERVEDISSRDYAFSAIAVGV